VDEIWPFNFLPTLGRGNWTIGETDGAKKVRTRAKRVFFASRKHNERIRKKGFTSKRKTAKRGQY